MIWFLYVFAYLVVGAVAVRVMDYLLQDRCDMNIASMVLILWPVFAAAGVVWLILKVFIGSRKLPCSPHLSPPSYREDPDDTSD